MPAEELVTPTAKQVFVIVESHPIIVESHSKMKMHKDVKHQIDNVEVQNKGTHSDLEEEKTLKEERRIEPRLSKYVIRHHLEEQIIGEKDARPMNKRSLEGAHV